MKSFLLFFTLVTSVVATAAELTEMRVSDAAGFRTALATAQPGTRIVLAGGSYGGGFQSSRLRGDATRPIVIAAADPQHPPVFSGAKTGLQLSNPAYLELHGLVFEKLSDNGLNLDDGGVFAEGEAGAHHIVLRGLTSRDIGTTGNQDGIKLSGLRDFRVEECTIERWGTGGGSAIDMVGCHRGVITGCVIRHREPAPETCTGVQCKGGTAEVAILRNRFEHAGGRAVNIGGSTGRPFFRPPLDAGNSHAEARSIRVEGNTFVGGTAAVGFVGVDGAVVRFNTIERPGRWALRILQETRSADFVACRNGVFSDNVIIFDSTQWGSGGVNVGDRTAPETFAFARNWWWCRDQPARSKPQLPTPESAGVYGRDPVEAKGLAGADAWPGRGE
ncbi:MAG: hypothetical protein NTV51_15945 [Verrucomicrobia bacterium]|nr:hypothetical protein [Verrucomicrobiota bacterium]